MPELSYVDVCTTRLSTLTSSVDDTSRLFAGDGPYQKREPPSSASETWSQVGTAFPGVYSVTEWVAFTACQ